MHYLQLLALGQLVVLVDVRINGIDLVPDPLGWALSVAAMSTLAGLHHGFMTVGSVSVMGVVASLPDWLDPRALAPLLDVALGVLSLVLVVATCTAIMETLPERAAHARAVRTSMLVVAAALVMLHVVATVTPNVGPVLVAVGLVATAIQVWFVVLLLSSARLPRPAARGATLP